MAVSFNIPRSPAKQVYVSEKFLGADFTSEASTVDDTKSPNVENMIRSVPGKIRKRMGYEKLFDYHAPIYGVHHLSQQIYGLFMLVINYITCLLQKAANG